MMLEIRPLDRGDVDAAGAILFGAFSAAARARGQHPPWPGEREAAELLARYLEQEPGRVLAAQAGGAVVGVGALRVRGDVATLGPLAVAAEGRGTGGALLDHLVEAAEDAGCASVRIYADAWNPPAYGLYTARGFGPVDLVVHIERPAGPAPALASSRGLEVRPAAAADMGAVCELDHAVTGQERQGDLAALVRYVALRRGRVAGFLGTSGAGDSAALGPAVAGDAADLATLIASAVAGGAGGDLDTARPVRARLSTAAPGADLAARRLGFRVRELGVALSRGTPPPGRVAQLYALEPELL